MNLSNDLISQFVKITNDKSKTKTEKIVYGTTVEHDGSIRVRFDGSTIPTPVKYTANIGPNERVMVQIKNHTATVIGNLTSPSARVITHGDGKKTVEDIDLSDFGGLSDRVLVVEGLIADKVSTDELEAVSGRIDTLSAEHATINGTISANSGHILELQTDNASIKERLTTAEAIIQNADVENLNAKVVKIEEDLEATNADIYNLESTYAEFVKTTTQSLEADKASIKALQAEDASIKGRLESAEADIKSLEADNVEIEERLTAAEAIIEELDVDYATVDELTAQKARIDDLYASKLDASSAVIANLQSDIAEIDTLIFGSASGGTIQSSFANAVIAQLGNAQIKSAMIDSVSASKITAGDIITNNVQVKSSDGKLLISDETIQISDDTRVRVQIGKDAANDYSINIWDESGKLMFSKGGITDAAIKEAIIRNDMVSDTANISASKLDIDSLFEEVNGSSKTIKSSKIFFDDKSQTLDVAFTSMTSSVTTVTETANTAAANAAKAQSDIDNLEIGGRNLLLDSGVEVNNNEYLVHGYVPSSPLIEGEQYTISMCVTPASGVSYLTLYLSGGSSPRVTLWPSGTDRQILTDVFTAGYYPGHTPDVNIYYANANIYRFPNDGSVTGNTTIHWIKIEKGNKATDWTPAPEDVESEIGSVSDRVTSQGTQISAIQGQIASKIWQQDIETVVDGVKIGGRNLLLGSSEISNYVPANGITVSRHPDGHLQIVAAATNDNYVPIYCKDRDYTVAETELSEGDDFTISFTMRSPDSTLLPYVYIKSGMGYYTLKGSMSPEWSTVWYAGKWNDTNPIDFHLGFSGRPGTYEIKNVKLEKGNKATDWTPAPEDTEDSITTLNTKYTEVKQQADGISTTVADHTTELANKAGRSEVTAVSDRVTNVETNLEGFKSTVSSTYATKTISDTRNDSQSPSWYFSNYPRQVVTEFKNSYVVGLPSRIIASGTGEVVSPAYAEIAIADGISLKNGKAYTFRGTAITELTNYRAWVSLYTEDHKKLTMFLLGSEETSTDAVIYTADADYDNVTLLIQANVTSGLSITASLETALEMDDPSITSANMVCTLTTTVPWIDATGGYPKQVAKIEGKEFWRVGISNYVWGPWSDPLGIASDALARVALTNTKIEQKADSITLSATKTELQNNISNAQATANTAITNVAKAQSDIDNLEIGGRNLLLGTSFDDISMFIMWSSSGSVEKTEGGLKITTEPSPGNGFKFPLAFDGCLENNTEYTLSFMYRSNATELGNIYALQRSGSNVVVKSNPNIIPSETDWQKFNTSFSSSNINPGTNWALLMPYMTGNNWIEFKSGSLKLEKGNKATDWTPAPEDSYTKVETDALIKVESDRITANVTETDGLKSRMSTVEQRADGLTVSLSETSAKADNASKTATNFLDYDATTGLQLGDKSSGSWSGYRTQILSDAFNILDADGMVCASYGKNLIELGKDDLTSRINLCGGVGFINLSDSNAEAHKNCLTITGPDVLICANNQSSTNYGPLGSASLYSTGTKTVSGITTPYYAQVEVNARNGVIITNKKMNSATDIYEGASFELGTHTIAMTAKTSGIHFGGYGDGYYYDFSIYANNSSIDIYSGGGDVKLRSPLGRLYFNDIPFGVNKILWSGSVWMQASQTATLSESISSQAHGVVLIFSGYDTTTNLAQNYNWNSHFIPKEIVASAPGNGHTFMMSDNGSFEDFAIKYLYIWDLFFTGNDKNKSTGTGACGITYDNRRFVLRYVIGV